MRVYEHLHPGVHQRVCDSTRHSLALIFPGEAFLPGLCSPPPLPLLSGVQIAIISLSRSWSLWALASCSVKDGSHRSGHLAACPAPLAEGSLCRWESQVSYNYACTASN